MADEIDRDQDINDRYLEELIARARSGPVSPAIHFFCCECGAPIPEKRRKALPGVPTCINCQSEAEKRPR